MLLNLGSPVAQSNLATSQILTWVLALIVLIVIGGLVVVAMRRKLLSRDNSIGHESGLMDEMRGMHSRGELTTEEYDRIRKRLAAKAAGKDPDTASPKPERADAKPPVEHAARPGFDLAGDRLPVPDPAEGEKPGESESTGASGPKPADGHDPEGFPEVDWPERSE